MADRGTLILTVSPGRMNRTGILPVGIAGGSLAMLLLWACHSIPETPPMSSQSAAGSVAGAGASVHAGGREARIRRISPHGMVDSRIRERLHGLSGLFTADELAFESDEKVARVMESLEDFRSNRLLGLAKLELALDGIDRSQLPPAYEQLLKLLPPSDETGVDAYRLLFRVWGRLDGAGALDRAMQGLPENRVRLEAGREAIESWARQDPAGAARKVGSLPQAYGTDYLIYALPRVYMAIDPVAGADWANALSPTYRSNALLHSMIVWLDRDPRGAQDYATSLALKPDAVSNDNGVIFSRVAGHMARESIDRAVRWVDRLPENGKARECALIGVIDWWGVTDARKAGEWLRTFPPSPTVDPAIDHFARDLVLADPVAAADWAKTISSEARRNACVNGVLGAWAELYPVAAVSWARANGYADLPALRQ